MFLGILICLIIIHPLYSLVDGNKCQFQIECQRNSTANVRLPIKASIGLQGPQGPPGQPGRDFDLEPSQLITNEHSLYDVLGSSRSYDDDDDDDDGRDEPETVLTELVIDSSRLTGEDFLVKLSNEYLDQCSLAYKRDCQSADLTDYDQISPYDGIIIDWASLDGITVREFWSFFENTINNSSNINDPSWAKVSDFQPSNKPQNLSKEDQLKLYQKLHSLQRRVVFFVGLKADNYNYSYTPKDRYLTSMKGDTNFKDFGQQLIMDQVVTNEGNCYDPFNGQFKAPAKGVYQFFLTISATGPDQTVAVAFMQNDMQISIVWAIGPWSMSSNQFFLLLEKNDVVWLKRHMDYHFPYPYMYSTFSGYLLYEDF